VAQRAGILLDAGDLPRGVAHEVRLVLPEGLKCLLGEETAIGQHDVQGFDRVTLALDVTVALGVGEGLRRNVQHVVVEDVENVHARQIAGGVSAPGLHDAGQQRPAIADGFEF